MQGISKRVRELKLKVLTEVENRLSELCVQDLATVAHILNECERDETAFKKALDSITGSGKKDS